ncbi:MAG: CoA-transferase [Bacillota bacterium]
MAINCAPSEFMAIVAARQIRDGDLVGCGAVSEIPRAALGLAIHLHAPNTVYYLAGTCCLVARNCKNDKMRIYHSGVDYRAMMYGVEARIDHEDLMFRLRDKKAFFGGGMQIDMYGNTNLVAIGDYNKPTVRGVGAVGTTTNFGEVRSAYLYFIEHSTRVFVPKVDFLSSPGYLTGWDARQKAGYTGNGPEVVITPMAVLDFETPSKRMRLRSVHSGFAVSDVVDNTGFELVIDGQVPTTPPPTDEEIKVLREKVDTDGILQNIRVRI